MRKWISLLLALCLAVPAACVAEEKETLVYASGFDAGTDEWFGRAHTRVTVTKKGTLLADSREEDYEGPARFFDLIAGEEYTVSVEVYQNRKESVDFLVTLESVRGEEASWLHLVKATVPKGEWTVLSGSFTAGESDSYQIYVETLDNPKLSFEIRDFRLESPDGIPRAKKTELSLSGLMPKGELKPFAHDGIQILLPEGNGWTVTTIYQGGYGKSSRYADEKNELLLSHEFTVKNLATFYEDPDKARTVYNSTQIDGQTTGTEEIQIDGHPAVIVLYDKYNEENDFTAHGGVLFYVRQNRLMQARLICQTTSKKMYHHPEETPVITLEDMRKIAERVTYDASRAPVTEEDVTFTVTAVDGITAAAAGKELVMDAEFVNPDKARKEGGTNYNRFTWSVIDPETGEPVPEVELEKLKVQFDKRHGVEKGRVTLASSSASTSRQKIQISRTLERVIYAEVVAESTAFHTKASCPVILLPQAKKMILVPGKAVLYTGSDSTMTLQAGYDPEGIPLVGLTWKAAKEGILEVMPGENGTAVIRPLAKGKTKITVTGPEGKNATVSVQVTDPVTGIELKWSGTAKAGKSVRMKAALQPATAGVKDVEWSVDTDESVASVSAKGVVSIAKGVPAGTVITVTCTALGAPEPVTTQVQIEVAE